MSRQAFNRSPAARTIPIHSAIPILGHKEEEPVPVSAIALFAHPDPAQAGRFALQVQPIPGFGELGTIGTYVNVLLGRYRQILEAMTLEKQHLDTLAAELQPEQKPV